MGTYDSYNKNAHQEIQRGEGNQKGMAYLVLGGSKFIYASAARLAVLKLLDTMNASADVRSVSFSRITHTILQDFSLSLSLSLPLSL